MMEPFIRGTIGAFFILLAAVVAFFALWEENPRACLFDLIMAAACLYFAWLAVMR